MTSTALPVQWPRPILGSTIRKSPKDGRQLYAYKCPAGDGQVAGWLLDKVVIDALVEYAGDPDKLQRRYAEALDAVQSGIVAERRAQLEGKIRDLEDRQTKLLDAVERGAVSDRVARRRSDEHEAAIREARGQLEVLGAAEYVPSLPDLKAILELAEDVPNASQEDQRRLLDRPVAKIQFNPDARLLTVVWMLGRRQDASLRDCPDFCVSGHRVNSIPGGDLWHGRKRSRTRMSMLCSTSC